MAVLSIAQRFPVFLQGALQFPVACIVIIGAKARVRVAGFEGLLAVLADAGVAPLHFPCLWSAFLDHSFNAAHFYTSLLIIARAPICTRAG